ncbi:MAG: hypothetical protein GY756_17585 [bacterium]|nr:hypothetical protein [bacterium]
MEYELSISKCNTYILVRVLKSITKNVSKVFITDAIIAIDKYGVNRLLIDVRGIMNVASKEENSDLVNIGLEEIGVSKKTRVAVLKDKDDYTHDLIRNLMVIIGYNCRFFNKENDAINFLHE